MFTVINNNICLFDLYWVVENILKYDMSKRVIVIILLISCFLLTMSAAFAANLNSTDNTDIVKIQSNQGNLEKSIDNTNLFNKQYSANTTKNVTINSDSSNINFYNQTKSKLESSLSCLDIYNYQHDSSIVNNSQDILTYTYSQNILCGDMTSQGYVCNSSFELTNTTNILTSYDSSINYDCNIRSYSSQYITDINRISLYSATYSKNNSNDGSRNNADYNLIGSYRVSSDDNYNSVNDNDDYHIIFNDNYILYTSMMPTLSPYNIVSSSSGEDILSINTPTIGDANSFDVIYGNSSNVVVYYGQFGGKVDGETMANETGAIIYRDGVEVDRVAVDDDGNWQYSISSTSLPINNYTFAVAYGGNEYYSSISQGNEKQVKVIKGTPLITTVVTIPSFKNNVSILVTVINGEGTPLSGITLTPTGTSFNALAQTTNLNGQATFTVNDLTAGIYSDWIITTTANDYYKSTNSSNITFSVIPDDSFTSLNHTINELEGNVLNLTKKYLKLFHV